MIGADEGIDLGKGSGGWVSIRDIVDRIGRLDVRLGAEVVARSADVRSVGEVARGAEHAVGILATQLAEQLRGVTVAHTQILAALRESIGGLATRLDALGRQVSELREERTRLERENAELRDRVDATDGLVDVVLTRVRVLERRARGGEQ